MSNDAIDQAILSMLSATESRSRKVVMAISKVAAGIGNDLPEGGERYRLVAQRIEALRRWRSFAGAGRHQEMAI